jgi:trehalose synthase
LRNRRLSELRKDEIIGIAVSKRMSNRLFSVEDYEPFIGLEIVDRILQEAKILQAFRIVNFNSTFYGGGVAELLSGMTLLMNSVGIKAEWRVIQGRPDFFNITKKMHNALQGADINLPRSRRASSKR